MEEDISIKMEGNERLGTFGGESWIDDWKFAEYGIDFEKCSIHNLSPLQMTHLACVMVDHLILNGHKFKIERTFEQDQRERLVCLTDFSKENES